MQVSQVDRPIRTAAGQDAPIGAKSQAEDGVPVIGGDLRDQIARAGLPEMDLIAGAHVALSARSLCARGLQARVDEFFAYSADPGCQGGAIRAEGQAADCPDRGAQGLADGLTIGGLAEGNHVSSGRWDCQQWAAVVIFAPDFDAAFLVIFY